MHLSAIGEIVNQCWLELVDDFANLSLDVFQVMPNHFHGIVVLWDDNRRDLINQIPTNQIPTGLNEFRFGPVPGWQQMKNPKQTPGKIIRHCKAKATKKIHDAGFDGFLWQSKFHDRIIRGDDELDRIRGYIRNNPLNWRKDDENPSINRR